MVSGRLRLCVLILFGLLALAGPVQAALWAQEIPLNASGRAYELNLDSQGVLWVSDGNAGEIRAVNAASGAYTIYPVGSLPIDARGDGAGTVWWSAYASNGLGRLSTGNNKVTFWQIPGSQGLCSTALEPSGRVWANDCNSSNLYRLDPSNNELCRYALPNSGVGEYLALNEGRIWIGDYANDRIVRLQGTTFTWWNLPAGSYPRDLAEDGNGRVWWTDVNKGLVGMLNPAAGSIITYTPPSSASGAPMMLQLREGKVWYSQQPELGPGRLVKLDPAVASGITGTVTAVSQAASPACSQLLPQAPVNITPQSGQASWTDTSYAKLIDEAGWSIYVMPDGSTPWGIAAANSKIWLVDNGRQVLASVFPSPSIYLPMITKS